MLHQTCRYELKFIISEPQARGVRDFLRSHLVRDSYAQPAMRQAYPIYSLYLDDPGLTLFRMTRQGQKNRYKLRVRYYDHSPAAPVFFEIKRRVGEVIIKDRVAVRRASIQRLLGGCVPRCDDLMVGEDLDGLSILRRFCELRGALGAKPRMIVYYEREAWASRVDEELRVTFDRAAAGAHYDGTLAPDRWIDPKIVGVVLELKFNDRFPLWMRELTQNWDLYRTKMGKYFFCMENLPPAKWRMSVAAAV